jgi:hypothetical protein
LADLRNVADDVGETGHADGDQARGVTFLAKDRGGENRKVVAIAAFSREKILGLLDFGVEFVFKTGDARHEFARREIGIVAQFVEGKAIELQDGQRGNRPACT